MKSLKHDNDQTIYPGHTSKTQLANEFSDYFEDKFKKIRVDFDITNIRSNVNSDGKTNYSLKGIMRIPNMFSEQQNSLPTDSSYNHLLEICDLVSLGFASNDTKTDDTMPRFNPNNNMGNCYKRA